MKFVLCLQVCCAVWASCVYGEEGLIYLLQFSPLVECAVYMNSVWQVIMVQELIIVWELLKNNHAKPDCWWA
jgi:hypothetical protein